MINTVERFDESTPLVFVDPEKSDFVKWWKFWNLEPINLNFTHL